jgi:ubiquinone/menaquinone biosynthesis C-methylase UbiE
MSASENLVFETYSEMAGTYDGDGNVDSCWGEDTSKIIESIRVKDEYGTIADIGCGTGVALIALAPSARPWQEFVGVEPADQMRARAAELTRHLPNVRVAEGAFESIPLPDASVDFLFSINSFHWVTDLEKSMLEMARVLKPGGDMDHSFIGRHIGREFVRATTPIFLRYMGPKRLLEATRMRQIYTAESTKALFGRYFGEERVSVEESFDCYYDSVERHLGWWVRIEPQLLAIPEEKRARCEAEVREALGKLDQGQGVPYTKHTLRVRVLS